MRIVGILLIAALMVAAGRRGATGRVERGASTIGISIGFGWAAVLVGLTVSYYGNLPPGGTIVLTGTGFFLLASVASVVRR